MEISPSPPPAASPLADEVLVALRRIIRAVDLHSRVLMQRYGLTAPQLAVLKWLSQAGPTSVGELARGVHSSHATVTGILDRLCWRELVVRERSVSDKRRVVTAITPAGEQMLAQTPPLPQELFLNQFQELHDWEQTQILSSLQRLVAMIDARQLEAPPLLAPATSPAVLPGGVPLVAAETAVERLPLDTTSGGRLDSHS